MKIVCVALLFIFLLMGCSQKNTPLTVSNNKLNVVATTSIVADLVSVIGDTAITVSSLMGAGVDPHLYKASSGDLTLLREADVIFYNGLHLEGKMIDVFQKLSNSKSVTPIAKESLQGLRKISENFYDPHIWFSVPLWKQAALTVKNQLTQSSPNHKAYFEKNYSNYLHSLDSLDQWIRRTIATISNEKRILVTAHDAFAYFGAEYGVRIHSLQGISTMAEFGINDIISLVNTIDSANIPAIFVESSVPPKSIEAVINALKTRKKTIKLGGILFSDALGEKNSIAGTYIGMVRTNVSTIVNALQ
ncbi:MAG: zinc ABC transporter substrate-binding protein [Candidatus Kapabacteria bacterium]|nr:zinc ABC transporter substrate-binding protein [Candidatus Kapabacteria bacterium]